MDNCGKFNDMVESQHRLNVLIAGDNYIEKNLPFYRAAVVECVELYDHLGYKWWKKQTPDIEQAKLELVDICHFMISDEIGYFQTVDGYCDHVTSIFDRLEVLDGSHFELIDELVSTLLCDDSNSWSPFFKLMKSFGMTFGELYVHYISKNALNTFRNHNGYMEGTYCKNEWIDKYGNEVEDNVVLTEIIEQLGDEMTFDRVYESLSVRYVK